MRNIVMAAVVALSGILAVGAPAAEAATTKVIIRDSHPRPHHRVVERRVIKRDIDRRCVTKKVVKRVHGERVVKLTKVCR